MNISENKFKNLNINKSTSVINLIYRIIITFVFLLLFYLMLRYPVESVYYAFTGLTLWFQKMIPALFPFMILSGIMIRMDLTKYFAIVLSPLLKPIFKVSGNGAYCIIMGFLCGFPMGAKVITDLYERQKISKNEATYLLSFCNNIGPIYFTGFVLPILGLPVSLIYLFGMYGLPLLYGMIIRFFFKEKQYIDCMTTIDNNQLSGASDSILEHIDDTIQASIESITKLGGYMILFNLLNLFPALILPEKILPFCNLFLEITSGISRMGNTAPLAVLIMLPFGGLSCIAQTYSIIKNTDLSLYSYCIHKCLLTLLTVCYYGVFFFALQHV